VDQCWRDASSAAIALVEVAAAVAREQGDGGVDQAVALIGIIGVGRGRPGRRCRGAGRRIGWDQSLQTPSNRY
jgi:hypothetical protein